MSEKYTKALPGPVFNFGERAKHTLFGQFFFRKVYIEIEDLEPKNL
jgi:hypothetical protein